jgi:hypothetical protein
MTSDSQPSSHEVAPSQSASLPLEQAIHSTDPEVLVVAASDPALTENLALAVLKRMDLSGEILERLSKNATAIKNRRVKLALVEHPKTPRHVSLPIVRSLFTFDMMHVALSPTVAADVKVAADEALCNRLETIPSGERLSLGHRASGRVATELLLDSEPRTIHAALENSRLTEVQVVKAVTHHSATPALIQAVCQHTKWSLRREIRIALLRSQYTPAQRALEFAAAFPLPVLKDILRGSRLPASLKEQILKARS